MKSESTVSVSVSVWLVDLKVAWWLPMDAMARMVYVLMRYLERDPVQVLSR